MRLLAVAHDAGHLHQLVATLHAHLFEVDVATPSDLIESAQHRDHDLVVIDLDDLPLNPARLLRTLRRDGWPGRLLVLKAQPTVAERVSALNAGADAFLPKPAASEELSAQVHALMRRSIEYSPVFRVADLEVDPVRRVVHRGGRSILLTPREFDLLEFLVRNRERPLTRARIVRHVWNDNFDGLTNVVDVYINYLRRKVDDGFPYKLICTARGVGYVLRAPEPLSTKVAAA